MNKNVVLARVNMHLENGQWKIGMSSNQITDKLIGPRPRATLTSRRAPRPGTPAAPMAKSNGTILGTFTLNGKPVRLRNVVARRHR